MARLYVIFLLVMATANATAANEDIQPDTVTAMKKNTVFRRIGRVFTNIFRDFNRIDTNYIERQHYNYTVMLQNTTTYEEYRIKSKSGQSFTFAPRPTVKIGPYVGWRWIFLGYAVDVSRFDNSENKKELDLSLYSSLVGIDLYYRKTGNNYRIRKAYMGDGIDNNILKGTPFSGLNVKIKGFDVYYIMNHRKFSYPAAFSQSTCQKRSCGSPLLGIGYMTQDISLDYTELERVITEKLHSNPEYNGSDITLDDGMKFNNVKYTSYSISGGYAYNWVFARNWLLAASLSVGLAYKKSDGDRVDKNHFLRDFSFNDINFDGIGRFGLVWNNTKWYAGASTILHSQNYHKDQFSTNSMFGSLNIYVGINFGKN